jgi:NTP pyrophosphatase (non-canonical NTP hydrolase)
MRAGLSSAPTIVLCKLTEEVGEVAKALIGEWESREGRGDPVQEAAQVIIVLASLIHITHPEADLFAAVWDEMERLGA